MIQSLDPILSEADKAWRNLSTNQNIDFPIKSLVSVIVPVFNSARFIAQAIESILNQTYSDIELIIVDDGSTDGTPQALSPFLDRIIYLRQRNRGVSTARNIGLFASRGEFIAFLDADDVLYPDSVAKRVQAMREFPFVDIVHTAIRHVDVDLQPIGLVSGADLGAHPKISLLKSPAMGIQTVLFRRTVFAGAGIFNPRISHFEDWDLYIRCADFQFRFLPCVTVDYRQHSLSASRKHDLMLSQGRAMLRGHRRRVRERSETVALNEGISAVCKHWLWMVWDEEIGISSRLIRIARSAIHYPELIPSFAVVVIGSLRKKWYRLRT